MSKELTALEALCYLDDIAHGRKMCFDPHCLKLIIEKPIKALNEILALHDKWLGYKISEFEFFTLLNEVRDKYD